MTYAPSPRDPVPSTEALAAKIERLERQIEVLSQAHERLRAEGALKTAGRVVEQAS